MTTRLRYAIDSAATLLAGAGVLPLTVSVPARDVRQRIGRVYSEGLHQGIVRALLEIACRVVGVTQLFVQPHCAIGVAGCPTGQFPNGIMWLRFTMGPTNTFMWMGCWMPRFRRRVQ